MAESAALLVDDVLPHQPFRQRVLLTHLIGKAGFIRATAQTGAVTQRFGRPGR
jgi:hypothetical protein